MFWIGKKWVNMNTDPGGGYGMMHSHMPWGMGIGGGMGMKMAMMAGMRCPVCGELLIKPTKEEVIEMLERKKKRLQTAIEHMDKEIERLKANPT